MDPGSLAILMQHLAPVLGALAFFAAPVGIIWILKHHKFRMRELELEAQHGISRSAEARLSAIEARLANIEQALGAPRSQHAEGARGHARRSRQLGGRDQA
jgi:hypothetical protein